MVGVTAFKDWLGQFTALGHRKPAWQHSKGVGTEWCGRLLEQESIFQIKQIIHP